MNWLEKLFTTSPRTRKYRPNGWNIEFDIPIDWKIIFEDRPPPPTYAVFGINSERAAGPSPSVLLFTDIVEESGESLDRYMDNAEHQLGKMFAGFKMIKRWKDKYQDAPSAILEYQYQGNNGVIQELNMTTFFGKHHLLAFQFVCEADRNTIKQDRALQRKIIDSIKVGRHGIRVPYLSPRGQSTSKCAACGSFLSNPNALFKGRNPLACFCDRCWRQS